jgi:hypothetical protein
MVAALLLLCGSAVPLAAQTNCLPPPGGLVGWWPGDGHAFDLLGTNNVVLQNGASFASGFVEQAFSLDGSDDRAFVAESPSTDISRMGAWTIEAWVKPRSFSGQSWPTIYSEGRWGASLGLNNGTGRTESWINNANQFIGNIATTLRQWNHVALVYDSSNRVLYVNGALSAVGSAPAIQGDGNGAAIGDVALNPNSSRFQGLIDEVSIFNRALSSNEIAAIFAVGVAGKCRTACPQRTLRASGLTEVAGQQITLPVSLHGQGNENALSFSLHFDPSLLTYRGETPGAGAVGASLIVNTNQLAAGNIGYALAKPFGQRFAAGSNELLRLRFDLSATPTNATVAFTNSPVALEVVDDAATVLCVDTRNSVVTITLLVLPGIVTQPQGRTVQPILGIPTNVTLSVTATGSPPLFYQWRFNGSGISWATNSSLTLTNVTVANSGSNDVVVSNSGGAVTSQVAVLTVLAPHILPAIVTQPQSWVASAGETVLFTVTASGTEPLAYQWRFGGSTIAGETNRVLVLTNVTPARNGNYSVVVTGPGGTATSANASLAVSATPRTLRLLDASVATAQANWSDRAYLSASSNSLPGATALATAAGTSPLASGEGYARAPSVTLPLNTQLQPGNYFLVVVADFNNAQPEATEANNTAFAPITLTLPPRPDLVVGPASSPVSALPGETVDVTWAVTNLGHAALSNAICSETVSISNALSGVQALARFDFTNSLDVGEGLVRTQQVALPAMLAAGSNWFFVTADSRFEVWEESESNNTAMAAMPMVVPAILTLQLSALQVAEGASVRATLSRNGSRAQALAVAVTNSDETELSFSQSGLTSAATVTIPAGSALATFDLWAVRDLVVDGPQPVTLGASASGYQSAWRFLTVLDVDVPKLTLVFDTNTVLEGHTVGVTVSRDVVTTNVLTVLLNSSSPSQLSPPVAVTIPGGSNSLGFAVLAVDDNLVEAATDYSLSASAPGFDSASATVTVMDNDLPQVWVTLASSTVSEGAGPQATFATVWRSFPSTRSLSVELVSSDTNAALVPTRVTIPANGTNTSFPVAAVNDAFVDGPQSTLITPYVLASGGSMRLAEGIPALLTVTDDDGPTLKLTAARKLVPEGLNPATTVTLTRNTPATNALVVNLFSNNTDEATVPPGVIIALGQLSAFFELASLADGTNDGNQTVTLTASSPGYTDGSETVVVTDTDLPDLVVSQITAPASAETESYVSVGYRVSNQGLGTAASNFLTRIYLSSDPVIGNDTLATQHRFDAQLPVNQYFEQNLSIRMPLAAGQYWVVAETDAERSVDEILEEFGDCGGAAPVLVIVGKNPGPRSPAPLGPTVELLPVNLFPPLEPLVFEKLGATRAPDGVCAKVKLRTEQESVITRDAFRATLEVDNADVARLEGVRVSLQIYDEQGLGVADLFGTHPPELANLSGVDGEGILPGQSSGTARWVLVPTVDAAPTTARQFFVTGRFNHT